MEDHLTSDQIVASVRGGLAKFIRLATESRKLDEYVRAVLAEPPREDAVDDEPPPAWERAFVHVFAIQDFLRRLDDRLADGRIRGSVDDAPSEQRAIYLRALAETDDGYEHDPGWRNGGLASYGAELETDEDRARDGRTRIPCLGGVQTYAEVVQLDGIPEVAWYYCASAFELGLSSIQDGLVAQLLLGITAADASSIAHAEGPTTLQIVAASRQRIVRQRLGQVAVHHQSTLELAYTDRRYDAQLVARYGEGLAPVVWRAAERAGEVDPDGFAHETARTLQELLAEARRDWPTYEPPQGGTTRDRIRKVADLVLWTAHERYRAVAGMAPPPTRRRRPKRNPPTLIAAGKRGRKRRQLVEVPRRAA